MDLRLVLLTLAIALISLAIGAIARRFSVATWFPEGAADIAGQPRRWWQSALAVIIILFVFEVLGVAASFYITQPVLKTGQRTLILSLIIAAANFGAVIQARGGADKPLNLMEPFISFKDGLLWPTALPAIAKVLAIPISD